MIFERDPVDEVSAGFREINDAICEGGDWESQAGSARIYRDVEGRLIEGRCSSSKSILKEIVQFVVVGITSRSSRKDSGWIADTGGPIEVTASSPILRKTVTERVKEWIRGS